MGDAATIATLGATMGGGLELDELADRPVRQLVGTRVGCEPDGPVADLVAPVELRLWDDVPGRLESLRERHASAVVAAEPTP